MLSHQQKLQEERIDAAVAGAVEQLKRWPLDRTIKSISKQQMRCIVHGVIAAWVKKGAEQAKRAGSNDFEEFLRHLAEPALGDLLD